MTNNSSQTARKGGWRFIEILWLICWASFLLTAFVVLELTEITGFYLNLPDDIRDGVFGLFACGYPVVPGLVMLLAFVAKDMSDNPEDKSISKQTLRISIFVFVGYLVFIIILWVSGFISAGGFL